MRYRTMGTTGTSVSVFGLGTMVLGAWGNADVDECIGIVHQALDAGVNLVDTADVYAAGETEEIVGRAIAKRRDEVVVATKFWNPMGERPNERGASRKWIVQACEASLRRLRTDRIDLYQIHRPDPDVGFDDLIDALDHLVRAGKVLHVGTSTWPAELIVEGQWAAARRQAARFTTEQPAYSIFVRDPERAVLPTCARHSLGVLVWAPLNGGWLTGKYRRDRPTPFGSRLDYAAEHMAGPTDAKYDAVERLDAIAADAGLPLAHLALAWVLEHPAVTSLLLGPKTPAQLAELLPAATVRLDREVLDAIDAVVAPGTTLAAADIGWEPWWLEARHRRRSLAD
jgi:aryl-alcohol dehydrogenase-like predicted oxidoreductase